MLTILFNLYATNEYTLQAETMSHRFQSSQRVYMLPMSMAQSGWTYAMPWAAGKTSTGNRYLRGPREHSMPALSLPQQLLAQPIRPGVSNSKPNLRTEGLY